MVLLLFFAVTVIAAGLAIRKNWWGMADQMSGKYISTKPGNHEKSWGWKATMIFGGMFMTFGILMILIFLYMSIQGE